MVPLGATVKQKGLVDGLTAMVNRCRGKGGQAFHSYIGQRAAKDLVPQTIMTNAAGYPASKHRPGGVPLYDTGYLIRHLAWKATDKEVSVYTYVPYGAILQRGGSWQARRRGHTAKGRRRWERTGRTITIRAYWWLTWRPEYRRELAPAAANWYWRGIVAVKAPPYGGNPGSKPTGKGRR